ncbi:4-hydroxy-tetrahydrodipicolinate reductase [Anaerovorax sp. IOR16]|uniref:4-hydroxy-tetrahydrodipicolinate reductase n=1 Tax=Anaerovorax sp. IOR16 TaxID=2773458 RepID=UPI0019D297BF|nr:4-hydroxy-tetrahydrodipicolinate reductase [Anaerovorax sp. IOR16]
MKNKNNESRIKVVLVGAGKTGKMVSMKIEQAEDMTLIGVVTKQRENEKCFDSFDEITETPSVIIDFSHPDRLDSIIEYAAPRCIPLVLGTTGYREEQKEKIIKWAQKIPIVYTSNFSLGITVLQRVLKQITPILKEEFDIELVEMHHNTKLDSPSGTAKMLLETLNESQTYKLVYGRSGNVRRGNEIGVHSIRGGSIAGQHNIIYAGEDEILEFSHQAHSNSIFAKGALKAARFILSKQSGLYDMNDVLFERNE